MNAPLQLLRTLTMTNARAQQSCAQYVSSINTIRGLTALLKGNLTLDTGGKEGARFSQRVQLNPVG